MDVMGILIRKLKDGRKLQTAVLVKEVLKDCTGTFCSYFRRSCLSELIVFDPGGILAT